VNRLGHAIATTYRITALVGGAVMAFLVSRHVPALLGL